MGDPSPLEETGVYMKIEFRIQNKNLKRFIHIAETDRTLFHPSL